MKFTLFNYRAKLKASDHIMNARELIEFWQLVVPKPRSVQRRSPRRVSHLNRQGEDRHKEKEKRESGS